MSSRYEREYDEAQPDISRGAGPLSSEFWAYVNSLHEAGDHIQRLWRAVEPAMDNVQMVYCPVCDHLNGHAPDCPREALRPLFGEESE